jgi:hypothetical protein
VVWFLTNQLNRSVHVAVAGAVVPPITKNEVGLVCQ